MATVIYFLRHGETNSNKNKFIQGHLDIPLNQNGLKQAELAGKKLQKIHFDAIYSSDLSRSVKTAEYVANGKEIIHLAELREWYLGDWQGKSFAEIEKLYPDELQLYRECSPDFTPKSGESKKEFRKRISDTMKKLAEKHPDGTILCVSHGGFIRTALLNVMNMERFHTRPRTDNTAISCFKTSDNGKSWQLIFWNDTCHLENFTESEGV